MPTQPEGLAKAILSSMVVQAPLWRSTLASPYSELVIKKQIETAAVSAPCHQTAVLAEGRRHINCSLQPGLQQMNVGTILPCNSIHLLTHSNINIINSSTVSHLVLKIIPIALCLKLNTKFKRKC